MATQRAHSAFLHYTDFGPAATDRERLGEQTRQITSEVASLAVASPLSGVVMTPRVSDKVGTYISQGAELAEVADLSRMRARIYVSEFEMYKFNADSPARLQLDGRWGTLYARTSGIAPLSSDVAPGLIDLSKYKGQRAPRFYVFDLSVENTTGSMRPGMAGTARLYGLRRSLASLAAHTVWEFLGRKIW